MKITDKPDLLRKKTLVSLVDGIPFCKALGIQVDYLGYEITAHLPFRQEFIGNPAIPALHGGVIGAFLEITAIIQLSWSTFWRKNEEDGFLKKIEDFKEDKNIIGTDLTKHLKKYASIGIKYVEILEDIIERNSLTDFDRANLLPTKSKKGLAL